MIGIRLNFFSIVCLFSLLVGQSFPLIAAHSSLWELGMGIGTLHAPYYRGSKKTKDYTIPFPLAYYRGEFFVSDEDGYRGNLFDNKRLKLDISVSGNLPVPEDSTSARADMPSLDTVGEFGPALTYAMWDDSSKTHSVEFEFPIRGVFSIGDPVVAYRGWVASPFVKWISTFRNHGKTWRYKASAGPIYGNSGYHKYFYDVEPQFATAPRPEYHASGGFSGTRFTIGFSRTTKHAYAGVFLRYDSLQNARFEDSPLVETDNYFFFGMAATWIFTRSQQRAPHQD